MGENADLSPFRMFTEVIQDAVIDLMRAGKAIFATSTSLTVCPARLRAKRE